MKKVLGALALALLAAGCTSTGGSAEATAQAEPAASRQAALVGTWTGSLDGGAAVRVSIPESGTPSYSFDGQRVPVSAVRESGSSLVPAVGSGGGTVTLTPQGDGLAYRYRFRGQSASATLSRA